MKYALFLIVLTLMLPLASCSHSTSHGPKPHVVVSLPVMQYFVDRLTQDSVEVTVMVPSGADHDTYSPKPNQMRRLASANAYLALGPLEFERTWHQRLTAAAPNMTWFQLTDSIDLITGHQHHDHSNFCNHDNPDAPTVDADPHFWLSPLQTKRLCVNMARCLSTIAPQFADSINVQLQALVQDLDSLHAKLTHVANSHPNLAFVIYHPALGYVQRDYGITQLVVGSEGVSVRPMHFAQMTNNARRAGVRVIFLQQGYSPERLETMANEIGAHIVPIQPEDYDYMTTMDHIISSLALMANDPVATPPVPSTNSQSAQ